MPPAPGAASLEEGYLQAAVKAANDDVWGSLSCSIFVHPATEAAYGAAVQRALDELRFGSVAVNAWSSIGFLPAQVGVMWFGCDAMPSVGGRGTQVWHVQGKGQPPSAAWQAGECVRACMCCACRHSNNPPPNFLLSVCRATGAPLAATRLWQTWGLAWGLCTTLTCLTIPRRQ